MTRPLRVLIVEDEVLIAMELELIVGDVGCEVVGIATDSKSALSLATEYEPDLAFVDINLDDGPTGIDVAEKLAEAGKTEVVFTSASRARIPSDFTGALGAIDKPYTETGMKTALGYLHKGLLDPPPGTHPASLRLSPKALQRWP